MNREALRKLRVWMEERGFPRFVVVRPENFAWLTGGDNTVVAGEGVAWLEVKDDKVILHTSRIEEARLLEEEGIEADQVISWPWYARPAPGAPNDLEYDLTPLRLVLSQGEQGRFRRLGHDAARALGEAVRAAKPHWTERELAGAIGEEALARGIQPLVLLVAGEERIRVRSATSPPRRPHSTAMHNLPRGDPGAGGGGT